MDDSIVYLENISIRGQVRIFNDRDIDIRVEYHDEENNLVWKTHGRGLDEALENLENLIGDYYSERS